MAKIIKKSTHLEETYYAMKQEQADKTTRAVKTFSKIAFIFFMVYIAASMANNSLSTIFMPLTICSGSVLAIVLVCLNTHIPKHANSNILISGITGENVASETLASLPDNYTIFQNAIIPYDGKTSEIDNIVVGRSGIFIVEIKNHTGNIIGDLEDTYWTQHKIGRGGTPYTKEMYNPTKQVGTHIYRLANYLRQNGIDTYVEGMVYFVNPSCVVRISGNSMISVYSNSDCGENRLCSHIMHGSHSLDSKSIDHICKLIHQL